MGQKIVRALAIMFCVVLLGNCAKAQQDQQIQPLTTGLIDEIDLSLAAKYEAPEISTPNTSRTGKTALIVKNYQWTASNEFYQNLIFEDPALERHGIGQNSRIQPVISGAKFFTKGFLYPLDVIKRHHKWCDNPLGWGSPAGIYGCR